MLVGKTLKLVVQIDNDHPGDPLVVTLTSKNWSQGNEEDWDFTHRVALTPSDVTSVILAARKQGWNPSKNTGHSFEPVELDLSELSSPPASTHSKAKAVAELFSEQVKLSPFSEQVKLSP
jgi:hypothetical protein